ncbi:MAG: TonB-dependent receptor [Acidobacteriota bacterium]|nr:TonB-dependent receptor [Acidobacteriota bacterium]
MRHRIWFIVLALAAGLASEAGAQITADGSIRGNVHDEQNAVLPGVVVTATGTDVAGVYTATTDASGVYRLLNVPPGTYTLSAELQGFSRYVRPNVQVRAGLNITIDVPLAVGRLDESVQVIAETPMLETDKPTQGVNISGEFQRSLPLGTRRDWSDFLEITPGVTSRTINNPQGGQMYLLRGGEIDGHVFQVDGADVGSFRQSLPTYMGLSTETIADVQVKTGGIDASSPLGTGVVVNIATQSGTNTIRGSGAMAFTPRSWNGDNTPNGTSAINEIFQADAALGGPIVRDRAWFYGTVRLTKRTTGIFRSEQILNNLRKVVPEFEPFDNESQLAYYFAKGTMQVSPKHQLLAFWQRDINPEQSSAATDAQRFNATAFGGAAYTARLSSVWTDNLTSRVSVSYNDKSFNRDIKSIEDDLGEGPSTTVYESAEEDFGGLFGIGALATIDNIAGTARSPTTKLTIQADTTLYKNGWIGSHEFQTGVFLQPNLSWINESFYPNNGFYAVDAVLRNASNPALGYVPFARYYVDEPSYITTDMKVEDYGVYLQDTWRPTERLTLNVGVRADRITIYDNIGDVSLQDSWNIGPRFGGTYALTQDRKNIIRASWARIHEQPYAFSIPGGAFDVVGSRVEYDTDLNGSFETVFEDPPQTFIATNRQLDEDRHMQFADEWIVGFRRQFRGQLSLDASFVQRAWKDRPANVEINGIYENGVFKGYQDERFNAFNRITNNEWNWMVYSGLEFTVAKRGANYQLLAGYTRAWDHVEGTWQPNDPASFIQPDAFANDRGIGSFRGGASDANSYSNIWNTRNSAWQDHQVRIGGSWTGPYGILLGSNYTFMSGPYSGPIIDRISASDPRFGPTTVRLSNGRVVANPLATRDRFVYPTRGEGQIKLPALQVLNARVGKTFQFGTRRVDLSLDVFNVTNNGAFQEFFIGQSNLRYSPNFILDANGEIRANNRQFARAAQVLARFSF